MLIPHTWDDMLPAVSAIENLCGPTPRSDFVTAPNIVKLENEPGGSRDLITTFDPRFFSRFIDINCPQGLE